MKDSLGNLAPCSIAELATMTGTRLKQIQYGPSLLDGFLTESGWGFASPW
ncbi:hypothetical protein ABZ851_35355 [Streptomyces sp. NPDC047049]